MLTIRLSRTGKRHAPQYRIVVQEKTQDPWAPAKEIVGTYNPHTQPSTVELKKERIEYWLEHGAQPSETVHNMLVEAGLIEGDKIDVVHITGKRKEKMAQKAEEAKEAQEAEKAKKAEEAEGAQDAEDAEEAPAEAPAEETAPEAPADEQKTE